MNRQRWLFLFAAIQAAGALLSVLTFLGVPENGRDGVPRHHWLLWLAVFLFVGTLVSSIIGWTKALGWRDLTKKGGRLVIIKARYGSPNNEIWRDVTHVVNSMVATDGTLTIKDKYNRLFPPDPIKGEPKQLTISYLWNGKEFSISAAEDHEFTLPL